MLLLLFAHAAAPLRGEAQRLRAVELRWDNDLFSVRGAGAPPDYDYTQGLQLAAEYAGADARPGDSVPVYQFALGQRIYTPRRDSIQPVPGERPYAGWLYASVKLRLARPGREDEFGVEVGITGPAALGEPVQNGVHRLLDSEPQHGWSHQLGFEPALLTRYRATWPLDLRGVELRPYAEMGVGTLWTGGAAGINARARTPDAGRGAYGEAGVRQEWVVHSLFLDGSTWNRSVRADKRALVTAAEAMAGYRFRHWAVEYRFVLRSPEYRAQPEPHRYGSLGLRWFP